MNVGSSKKILCTNCGAVIHGKYCSNCGQKKFDKKDLTVAHFIEEALHTFTHFDSKIFKAIRYLFAKPGFLTKEFSEGKINSYIRPITLFILLNAFLFFFIHVIFPFKDSDYNFYIKKYPAAENIFNSYQQAHHLTQDELEQKFNTTLDFYKKLEYFIIIPLFSCGLYLIFIGRKKLYVEFLVQAIHTFSWYVLMVIILIPLVVIIAELLHLHNEYFETALSSILFIVCFLYNYFSIKRIFSFKSTLSFVYTLPVTSLMIYLDTVFSAWLIFQLTSLHFKF
jgi:hypothetical protein